MKTPVFFPVYCIYSDLVKAALGVKDNRSVDSWLEHAGIPVITLGDKKMVRVEDILNAGANQKVFVAYKPQSNASKALDSIE